MAILFILGALVIAGLFIRAVYQQTVPFSWVWLFVIGGVLGSTWEMGFTYLDMAYEILPGGAPRPDAEGFSFEGNVAVLLLVLVVFCTWDAGIFIAGPLIARRVLRRELFAQFSWAELGILLAWGQVQSFAVEMAAITGGWWAYAPTRTNPQLFPYLDGSITLWPQLVWVLAYLVFYAAALVLAKPKAN
ncbi:MAG: hypothetical protein AAFR65_06095 [Pseudomonadota bacterium]